MWELFLPHPVYNHVESFEMYLPNDVSVRANTCGREFNAK